MRIMGVVELLRSGTRLARRGKYVQAVKKFTNAVATADQDPRGWFGLGVCSARCGNMEDAREALEEARRLGHPRAREAMDKLLGQHQGGQFPVPPAQSPAHTAPAEAPAEALDHVSAEPERPTQKIDLGKHVRVMLIEDRSQDREAICEALHRSLTDVEVLETPFAQSASMTIVGLGIFDVAIVNWDNSPTDARQLLQFLKLKQPHIPVIVLTHAWSEDKARQAIEGGADYCLVKASGYARILPFVIEQRFKHSFALQQKIEAELAGQEREERKYFDAMDRPIIVASHEGKVLETNRAAAKLLGTSSLELVGQECQELYSHDSAEGGFFPIEQVFAVGEPVTVERHDPALGRWFRVTTSPVRDEEHVEYLNVLEDITDQKGGEPAGGQALRDALNQLDQPLFYTDAEGKFVYVNEGYARLVGRPAEELVGHTEKGASPDDAAERRFKEIQTVLATGEPLGGEELTAGIWLAYRLTPISNGNGGLHGVLGLAHDVTALKQTADRGGPGALGRLADLSGETVFELDKEGRVTFANEAAGRLLGRSASELAGSPFDEFVAEHARSEWDDVLQRAMGGQTVSGHELTLCRPDGSQRFADLSLMPVAAEAESAAVSGVRGILKDASDRKRIHAALEILQDNGSRVPS